MYDRDADTWTDVPTNVNSVCGGWARLANGQVGLFAGHYATIDVYQVRSSGGESSCKLDGLQKPRPRAAKHAFAGLIEPKVD